MRGALLLLGSLALLGCNVPPDASMTETPLPPSANGAMYGTDASLAPSKPDAILRYADQPRGFAELRLPSGKGPFPLAVIFHGGCFKTGIADQAYMSPLATRWQQQGVASLNVDYREVGDGGGWPGSFEDWDAAARLIDQVAARYPVDRDRVTLVGHSAGALPALWLATSREPAGPAGFREATHARAAIVLDGPADLGTEAAAFDALCQFSSVEPFLRGGNPAAIQPAPRLEEILFVPAKLPPPPAAALALAARGGAKIEVVRSPGNDHFSIITPGTGDFAAVEGAMLRVLKAR